MGVSIEEVKRIAALAKLSFSDEELDGFTKQFNEILEYMDTLNELDTEGVEPLSHPVEGKNTARNDEVTTDLKRDEALKNAPETDGEYFIVPRIIKTEKQ